MSVSSVRAECGMLAHNYRQVACRPRADAFSPCEDLMGGWALRAAVWLVALTALVGNLAVVLVLLFARRTVPSFLMAQLATADLCMGLYLLLLAAQDARSVGTYFTTAVAWQTGKIILLLHIVFILLFNYLGGCTDQNIGDRITGNLIVKTNKENNNR